MTDSFHINSTTTSEFNCTHFDQLSTTSKITPSRYSCFASLPGSSVDSAIHYSTPSSPLLPTPAKVVVIIISIIIGIALIACLLRCCSRTNPTLRQEREAMELEE